jgi:hypothetical protein
MPNETIETVHNVIEELPCSTISGATGTAN